MEKHWILDRDDPRTVLAFCVVVLVAGLIAAVMLVRDGGAIAIFAVVWLVVAVGQVAWASSKVVQWRRRERD